jgi:glycosyltransferase involved in cell wall biosynthesis
MMPRILMVIHQFRPVASGAELQAERLAQKLVGLGHEVGVLTQLRDAQSATYEKLNGITVHRVDFPLSYWTHRDIGKQLKFLINNRHTYDIIHSHQCFNHAVLGTVVAKWFGKKSILKIACAGDVGDLSVFSRFKGFKWVLKVLRQTDATIAISREVEKELKAYGLPEPRVHRIPNGVDTEQFKRFKPFPERSKNTFILIGRRTPQKGIDVALKALKLLSAKGINEEKIILKLYGLDFPEHDYKTMAAELGVLHMVQFLCHTDSIKESYQDAHCLILPSRTEGLSNVLLEAMSFEMPVIATGISGTVDVVDHEKDGIVIQPDDPEALANAMEFIIKNPEKSYHLGKNARQKVIENFSLDETARRYSELYQRLKYHA